MLNCRNASSSSGDWRQVPSSGAFSLARMIQGFTDWNFSMKLSMSTTRSRTIGKLASGSISTTSPYSASAVLQVSLGSPFTFMPQLPQTAMRQDQRWERVGSTSSLMKLMASRTFQSGRHSIS